MMKYENLTDVPIYNFIAFSKYQVIWIVKKASELEIRIQPTFIFSTIFHKILRNMNKNDPNTLKCLLY